MATVNSKLEVIVAETLENAHEIVSAFDHVGSQPRVGFTLAACCAMVENESGGRNVWGHDQWDRTAYPKGQALFSALEGAVVTEDDYHRYKTLRNSGMQPQGCGPAQLTSSSLQVAAEQAGGCWVPFYNLVIGFRFLLSLFNQHGGAFAGFAAYNGSGPAADAYAQRAVVLAAAWQHRFNVALG